LQNADCVLKLRRDDQALLLDLLGPDIQTQT